MEDPQSPGYIPKKSFVAQRTDGSGPAIEELLVLPLFISQKEENIHDQVGLSFYVQHIRVSQEAAGSLQSMIQEDCPQPAVQRGHITRPAPLLGQGGCCDHSCSWTEQLDNSSCRMISARGSGRSVKATTSLAWEGEQQGINTDVPGESQAALQPSSLHSSSAASFRRRDKRLHYPTQPWSKR